MSKFVISDESVKNSHGFYLQNSGGDFTRFSNNPVMLLEHDPKDVIGKWVNLAINGARITADAIFDKDSAKGAEVAGQVERDYLIGASVGIIVKRAEWRINPLSNEEELYVTEWELLEVSVVSMPANPVALKVYSDAVTPVADTELSAHLDKIAKLSMTNIERMNIVPTLTTEALTVLGLNAEDSAFKASAAIVKMAADLKQAQDDLDAMKRAREDEAKARAEALVSNALAAGKITADRKEAFIKLALSDYAAAEATLSAIPGKTTYGNRITPTASLSSTASVHDDWNYHDWKKNDPAGLENLRVNNPDEYASILKKSRK